MAQREIDADDFRTDLSTEDVLDEFRREGLEDEFLNDDGEWKDLPFSPFELRDVAHFYTILIGEGRWISRAVNSGDFELVDETDRAYLLFEEMPLESAYKVAAFEDFARETSTRARDEDYREVMSLLSSKIERFAKSHFDELREGYRGEYYVLFKQGESR